MRRPARMCPTRKCSTTDVSSQSDQPSRRRPGRGTRPAAVAVPAGLDAMLARDEVDAADAAERRRRPSARTRCSSPSAKPRSPRAARTTTRARSGRLRRAAPATSSSTRFAARPQAAPHAADALRDRLRRDRPTARPNAGRPPDRLLADEDAAADPRWLPSICPTVRFAIRTSWPCERRIIRSPAGTARSRGESTPRRRSRVTRRTRRRCGARSRAGSGQPRSRRRIPSTLSSLTVERKWIRTRRGFRRQNSIRLTQSSGPPAGLEPSSASVRRASLQQSLCRRASIASSRDSDDATPTARPPRTARRLPRVAWRYSAHAPSARSRAARRASRRHRRHHQTSVHGSVDSPSSAAAIEFTIAAAVSPSITRRFCSSSLACRVCVGRSNRDSPPGRIRSTALNTCRFRPGIAGMPQPLAEALHEVRVVDDLERVGLVAVDDLALELAVVATVGDPRCDVRRLRDVHHERVDRVALVQLDSARFTSSGCSIDPSRGGVRIVAARAAGTQASASTTARAPSCPTSTRRRGPPTPTRLRGSALDARAAPLGLLDRDPAAARREVAHHPAPVRDRHRRRRRFAASDSTVTPENGFASFTTAMSSTSAFASTAYSCSAICSERQWM
jgi:hypothetical protein